MPIYVYYCDKCDQTFDLFRSCSVRDDEALCPHCLIPSKRVFSHPNVNFMHSRRGDPDEDFAFKHLFDCDFTPDDR